MPPPAFSAFLSVAVKYIMMKPEAACPQAGIPAHLQEREWPSAKVTANQYIGPVDNKQKNDYNKY